MDEQLRARIASRGYWRVLIRPAAYEAALIPYNRLGPIVDACRVQLRGWDFPHRWRDPYRHEEQDAIGQSGEWMSYLEAWQFFQSGLFVFLGANRLDWLEQAEHLGQWREVYYKGV